MSLKGLGRFDPCSLRKKGTIMKVKTFDDDQIVEGELLSGPSATGLCKVKVSGRVLARHVDRLTPLDEEARRLLKK